MNPLRLAARDQSCVRCGAQDGTVVLAHYSGARRLDYRGGFGRKVEDWIGAHLCFKCHQYMDTLSKDKEQRWLHSEEFLHYVAKTIIRLADQGIIHARLP